MSEQQQSYSQAEVYSEVESFERVDQPAERGAALEPEMQKWLLHRMTNTDRQDFTEQYNAIMEKERRIIKTLKVSEVLFVLLTVVFLVMYGPLFFGILF